MNEMNIFKIFVLSMLPISYSVAEEKSAWAVTGLIEANAFAGNMRPSWLEGELGKFRVGDGGQNAFVSSAAALSYEFNLQSKIVLEAAYHYDPNDRVGITQAYWNFKPLARGNWQSQYRLGAFHVPVSMEHSELLWQSKYTIAPSMINTWVGEELRTLGAQGRWSWRPNRTSRQKLSFTAAFFGGNDSAGAMLAWRGWAAHSRQSVLGETIKMPALPVIAPGNPFSKQAQEYEPFVEVDDTLGHYIGLDWDYDRKLKISYLYYDNRADPLVLEDGQYGWHTRFHHIGLKAKLSKHWAFVSQLMTGTTIMGPRAVDNEFTSGFALLTRKVGRHRVSVRIEAFDVDDRDFLSVEDPNDEHGQRATVNYSVQVNKAWSASFELSRLRSNRDYRALFGEKEEQTENQVALRLRYQF